MFGTKLKELRKSKGYSMDKLAESYNKRFNGRLSKGTLSKYENGKQEPRISNAKNLASILGVSVDYLVYDDIATNHIGDEEQNGDNNF